VTGATISPDFPLENAYQDSCGGEYSAFVTKLNSTGTSLLYSTYLGGNDYDDAYSIAIDTSGNAYVAGITDSIDFPPRSSTQLAPACYTPPILVAMTMTLQQASPLIHLAMPMLLD